MGVDISKLSSVYNNSNTESISNALNKIKLYFGARVFESLLRDIISKNNVGIDGTLRNETADKPYYYLSPNDKLRNEILSSFKHTLDFANRYNSPEAKCDDCGKIASDVFSRPGIGRSLCTACYEKLVPHTKVPAAIVKAIKSYGYTPDNNEDMFVTPTDEIKDMRVDLEA